MNRPLIGMSTGCFYPVSIFEVLAEIRDAGFKVLEICSFPRHLDYHDETLAARAGERMRELGLRPYSFHAPFAENIDITSLDDGRRARAVEELLKACRAASLLGAENVVLHPGPEREGRPPEEEFLRHMRHAAESLDTVAAFCTTHKLRLLLENMLPHLLFGHVSDMLYLLGEIHHRQVGACLDTGHAFLSGDLPMVANKLSGHLKMLHVNDNHGDWDSHLPPGEGRIDWRHLMRELHRQHFHGAYILETGALEGESVHHTLARIRRGRDYLEKIWAEVFVPVL